MNKSENIHIIQKKFQTPKQTFGGIFAYSDGSANISGPQLLLQQLDDHWCVRLDQSVTFSSETGRQQGAHLLHGRLNLGLQMTITI